MNLKSFIFSYIKTKPINIISLVFIMGFLGASPSINSILLQKLIDTFTLSSKGDYSYYFYTAIYLFWFEVNNILWRLYDYIYLKTIPIIKSDIIQELFHSVLIKEQRYLQKSYTGDISSKINMTADSYEQFFAKINEQLVYKIFLMISAIITLYSVHYKVGNLFMLWIMLFLFVNIFSYNKATSLGSEYSRRRNIIGGKIVDAISNITSIKMFHSYHYEKKILNLNLENKISKEQNMQIFMLKIRYILSLSSSIMMCYLVYSLSILYKNDFITVGDFALVVSLCSNVSIDIRDLIQEIGDIYEELGMIKEGLKIFSQNNKEISNIKNNLNVQNGEIKLINVTFKYKEHDNIFTNQSVTIKGKQRIGLVGYSGSGKTTFVNLITKIYQIEQGNIFIDNQSIYEVSDESLKNNIAMIPQNPVLFNRSIKENIAYGLTNYSNQELIEAAKKAHIHESILNLPNQYDSLCGEMGKNLSGGQKQLISIARAIMKNAPILILDEATSNLDPITESYIQDSIKYLMNNKTVIVIAHKLQTLLDMDRILVFDKGSIIEDGNHEYLIKKGGLYTKFWNTGNKNNIVL